MSQATYLRGRLQGRDVDPEGGMVEGGVNAILAVMKQSKRHAYLWSREKEYLYSEGEKDYSHIKCYLCTPQE